MKCSIPASLASSTTYWIKGLSTIVSISFGIALVAGRTRVPRPATGKTALRIFMGKVGGTLLRTGKVSGSVGNRFLAREQSWWRAADAKTSILLNYRKPQTGLLKASNLRQRMKHDPMDETNRAGDRGSGRGPYHGLGLCALGASTVFRRGPFGLAEQHLLRPEAGRISAAVSHALHHRTPSPERRGRSFRPSPDDGSRNPPGGRQFRQLHCRDVA